MSILDTIKVDGTDLQTYASIIEDFSGVFTVAARRGANYQVPGKDGAIYVAKPLDVSVVSLGLVLLSRDPSTGAEPSTQQGRVAQMIANYRSLVTLCKAEAGGTVTLTRTLSTTGGSSTSQTCLAECAGGIEPVLVGPETMRVVLDFTNLDGKWS